MGPLAAFHADHGKYPKNAQVFTVTDLKVVSWQLFQAFTPNESELSLDLSALICVQPLGLEG